MKAFLVLSLLTSVSSFTAASKNVRGTTSLHASALIVQNKGGGHGELGYQLAKNLLTNDKISSVTILQDDACKDDQEPFKSYGELDIKVVKASLSDDTMSAADLQKILGDASFEYVWDNASKKPEGAGKACIDCAKDWGVSLYTYVSSGGIYTPAADGPFPMPETTPVKESAGQTLFDNYAVEQGLPLVSFRPQYIYGEKSNKFDYIDYYFDRLVRELPIPIPGDGTQLVSLTNSEDVASLLASPLKDEKAAVEQRFFNCGTDQLVSYDDVATLCAKAAGVESVNIEHYDADMFGKANFPFRLTNFYVAPDTAKRVLGWEGAKHDLAEDMNWYFKNYKARGGPEKKMSLVKDWEIVVGSKTTIPESQGSIYDKYDPIVLEVMD